MSSNSLNVKPSDKLRYWGMYDLSNEERVAAADLLDECAVYIDHLIGEHVGSRNMEYEEDLLARLLGERP